MQALERLVFLDTETTGLDPRLGHRIIELAGVEALGRHTTGKSIHFYLDPEREIDAGATAVHGYTWDDLRDKPKFAAVIESVMEFLAGARVIIHNAPFDVSFLDNELARLRLPLVAKRNFVVEDSLAMARAKYPGKRNSLDSLCDRLGVDNSQRNLHGALLDARLLADVYFAMTREQGSLEMTASEPERPPVFVDEIGEGLRVPLELFSVTVPDEFELAHSQYVLTLNEQSGQSRAW
ncbi:MAG: DNA polymerase III subunit epsilon [Rhizobacter sp.]|nr:DNA polymerase III subunit epsilon [Burkholderiales bacterium]